MEQDENDFANTFTVPVANLASQQALQEAALKEKLGQDKKDHDAVAKAADVSFNVKHPGLITQLESLSNFEKSPDGKSAGIIRFILLLVIICIDTSPIVIKLLTKRGVYEEMMEADEDRMKFLSKEETVSNKFLVRELALAQKEVLGEAVRQWREKEKTDPNLGGKYIKSDPPTVEEDKKPEPPPDEGAEKPEP